MRPAVFLFVCVLAAAFAAPALAQPAPVTWCGGSEEIPADRVPALDVASSDQVRFVYAVPAGEPDHFPDYASGIATDAAWIAEWWQAQDPTRAPRFDRYPFPGCATTFGALDIGVKRLGFDRSTYLFGNTPSSQLDTELRGLFTANQKTIVYFDGPIRSRTVCGETNYLANGSGGDEGIVYVYLQSNCDVGLPGAGGTAEVAAHELLHNLGAVPGFAPNECPRSSAHACDSTTDVMYPFVGDGSTLDSVVLDFNHDDYYAHDGAWWDVQDSDWLTRFPQFPFTLTVFGSGTLVSPLPCTNGCTELQLDDGESVSVRAVPSRGWRFASWSGGCAGSVSRCTLEIGGPTTATAVFVRASLRIAVSIAGRGRVTSAPAGISCPGRCAKTFATTEARLTAHAAAGWRFAGWGGACTGSGVCTLDSAGSARARFARR